MLSPLTSLKPQDGMPVLNESDQPISFFEFWPAKIFYLPLIFYIIFLMLRYRSVTLPSLANPSFAGGGFCGESKADILSLLSSHVPDWSVDFITHIKSPTDDIAIQTAAILQKMSIHDLCLPVVAKPDLGCRGAGVHLIRQHEELYNYVQDFPASETIILQRFVDYEGEAGIFYIRHPNEQKGHIFSLTLKYFPYVFGDGQTTLKNLILQDPRAGRVPHLYLKRLADHLQWVPPQGQAVRLVFSGSHSKGAIFRDGQSFITMKCEMLLTYCPKKSLISILAALMFGLIKSMTCKTVSVSKSLR